MLFRSGVSAERFETPLAGGAAASMCASAVCWRTACQRRGGNPPAPAFPRRGNGKEGVQTSLLPQAVRVVVVRMPGTPLVYCVLALLPRFSPFRSPTYMSIRSIRFPEVLLAPPTPLPCFYPHSLWAAIGPVQVGVRSQAQVHHHGDGPGLLGAAIYLTISEGS